MMNSQYSGVFTPTTPTLTPTTLRSIEQTILGMDQAELAEQHHGNGNFVPPLPNSIVLTNTWQGGSIVQEEEDFIPAAPPVVKKARGGKRAAGGRRPNNSKLSPEEDERRKVRRERNKLAAARCRKRRVDHTNTLVEETEKLESTKLSIQKEINLLQSQRDELEFILQAHNTNCDKMQIKKSSITNNTYKKPRPTTLPVCTVSSGITLSTPSTGLFDLDWNDLKTGLTPTSITMTPLVTPSTASAILGSLKSEIVDDEYVEL